jgi:hypothetical protein
MVVERNRSSQVLGEQSDRAEAQTLTLQGVDVVGQTYAIVANFDCNRVVIVRRGFDCDRACDPGRVSVFDRIRDELADEQPERDRLFRRKDEAQWEQAVD